jgi:hypothetical protein
MVHHGTHTTASQVSSGVRASMQSCRSMHAHRRSVLAALEHCSAFSGWGRYPPPPPTSLCMACRAEIAAVAASDDAGAATSPSAGTEDPLEAQPAPSYAAREQWTSRHYRKAQARRMHDSRPGSQSLTSLPGRDVVSRRSPEDVAQQASRQDPYAPTANQQEVSSVRCRTHL